MNHTISDKLDSWPSPKNFNAIVRADFEANDGSPKIQLALILFRFTQLLMKNRAKPRWRAIPAVAVYRFYTEIVLGFELRPKTVVGKGLAIHHGFGLVVNNNAIVGSYVSFRNGVVIGHKRMGGGSPVIGDRVIFGANSVALGSITIGDDSTIGAGAIVAMDVPAGAVAFGNPASVRSRRAS